MYEERMENEGARHTCSICCDAVIEGVLSPEGEAICGKCLEALHVEELLVLCGFQSATELLTALDYDVL